MQSFFYSAVQKHAASANVVALTLMYVVPCTGFSGGSMQLSANISSQYVSSVLLSAPYALEPLVLKLEQSAAKKVSSLVVLLCAAVAPISAVHLHTMVV